MNNTLIIVLIVFALISAAAFAGMMVRDHLPDGRNKEPCKRIDSRDYHPFGDVPQATAGNAQLFSVDR